MKTQQILEVIEQITEVKKSDIFSTKRYKKIMFARHLYCYFAKEKTNATLMEIGNSINRHHSTVINSLKLISDMIYIDDEVTKEYLDKINATILTKFEQPQKLQIILPFDVDIQKVILYLKNEYRAKCVKII
jgi:hypothetical protein